MKVHLLCLSICLSLCACQASEAPAPASSASATSTSADSKAQATGEPFFTFEIDGKAMTIPIADISSRAYPSGELKIFAGAYQALSINLTIPDIDKCPCVVPAGSVEPASPIGQGSVSLQGFPNPNNGLNSWYVGQTGVPAANAIEITDVGSLENGARMISGTFNVRVLKTESNGDGPENKDYDISNGRFAVRHEVPGSSGF
jgi:hypothetical protein